MGRIDEKDVIVIYDMAWYIEVEISEKICRIFFKWGFISKGVIF